LLQEPASAEDCPPLSSLGIADLSSIISAIAIASLAIGFLLFVFYLERIL
jgi:hypothetical protein